jgi:hypothetical protein
MSVSPWLEEQRGCSDDRTISRYVKQSSENITLRENCWFVGCLRSRNYILAYLAYVYCHLRHAVSVSLWNRDSWWHGGEEKPKMQPKTMVENEGYLRRLACQIAAQLPDDKQEALRALRLVRQIVFNLGETWDSGPTEPVALFPDRGAGPRVVQGGLSGLPDKSSRG